jgi:acyl carrier protein
MASTELRDLVTSTVSDVLGVEPGAVAESSDLTVFPTFTSFRALDIVETVEQRLGVEVDPNDLVPENLHRVDSLCDMFEQDRANTETDLKEENR